MKKLMLVIAYMMIGAYGVSVLKVKCAMIIIRCEREKWEILERKVRKSKMIAQAWLKSVLAF